MSEYRLQTWSLCVYEKHKVDQSVNLFDELRRPDLYNMAVHYLKESQRAIRFEQQNEEAEPDPRWKELGNKAFEALAAITTEDAREIASAFYYLGRSAESLSHPSIDEQMAYRAAYIEKLKSELPLRVSTERRNFLIEEIQESARKRWATDLDKDFRVTEMCELLLSEAQDIARQIGTKVPTKADTLKPWLREIAPKYAKKQGRPRKSDLIMQSER